MEWNEVGSKTIQFIEQLISLNEKINKLGWLWVRMKIQGDNYWAIDYAFVFTS